MSDFYQGYIALAHRFEALLPLLVLLVGAALTGALIWNFRARCSLGLREEHFRNLAEASFEAIVLSRDGIVVDCNERAEQLSGYARQDLLGRPLLDLFTFGHHATIRKNIATGYDRPYEVEGLQRGGNRILLEVRGKTFRSNGHLMRASSMRDITARRQEETQLRKLSAAVEHSPASIVITDREGRIEYVNAAFCRMTGYSRDEVLGRNPRMLKAGDTPEEFYRELWETLLSGEEWRGEFHNKRKDGTLFWELASISPITNEQGEITHFVAVKDDITERQELRDQLEQMARFDMLTGLPNRRMFLDRLAQAVAVAQRSGQRFALLFVDLDGFKRINDTYGHEAGDRVLKTVAARLSASIRISDTAGRIGGDEFTVILGTLAHHDDAGQVAGKILKALRRPVTLPDGRRDSIAASIGISVFPDDARDGDGLLATADDAMYAVKHSGKNNYRFYRHEPATEREETIPFSAS
ncbi:MAG: PAS domain S-box protein [Geobacter sp.]|nr:PAS domain S-box protein [Geobacter sp.]